MNSAIDIFKQIKNGIQIEDARDIAAQLLKTTPEALQAFEQAYSLSLMDCDNESVRDYELSNAETCDEKIIERIVNELLDLTEYIEYDGEWMEYGSFYDSLPCGKLKNDKADLVALDELQNIPVNIRPQLTGRFAKKDINASAVEVLFPMYAKYLHDPDPEMRKLAYHIFRQGMDLLDIDPILYKMLEQNPVSMSKWLPHIVAGIQRAQSFLKIPKTRIVRVPMPVLQMSRIEYESLTPSTIKIINNWAFRAFKLDANGDYFIKTGTYSSKFDFRNARVVTEKEVRELGSYLLYIQYQATCMAGPLNSACFYGVSTTNEWVVREFIQDAENNPAIYQGLPLHTEYRCFVDFDTKEVLGIAPYWDPDTMKNRFKNQEDQNHPHMKHDYVIYKMHEETLMRRFHDNRPKIAFEIERILPHIPRLQGQYSIDVMQNGNDFWIIDMATADTSALKEYMPANALKKSEENWLAIDLK